MSLDRFKTAQADPDSGYAVALGEIRAGAKTKHWIWYVFPQLAGLGRSPTARFYGLHDRTEAVAYLHDPLLGARLHEITAVAAAQLAAGVSLATLMGSTTDCQKLVSCLTLFTLAAPSLAPAAGEAPTPPRWLPEFLTHASQILAVAAAAGYPGCAYTVEHASEGRPS